jgi:hypothetical protein
MTRSSGLGFVKWLGRWCALMVTALLLSSGLQAGPGPFPYARIGVTNGCFVESVAFGDELRTRFGNEVWYRLLQWGAKEADEVVAGHAVVVFEHRSRLWSYDINHGFTVIEVPLAQRGDVAAVAKLATAPYLEKITPRYPIYREDFPSAPDPSPPVPPGDEVADRDLRDASLVAARLAKYRAVKLVEFSYPKEGVTKQGAAVAFVFNGRLCVYSSSYGTVPFRVTAITVENIRQLQELLRRMYPGASNLRVR